MTSEVAITELVKELAASLRKHNQTLATVESCTGGLVGAALTELAGISDVYLGGFVTYSNMAKQMAAGVNPQTLVQHGAVSSQVAIEMGKGGCGKLLATNSIAITGIAGPDGGSDEKPVGTVWICVAQSNGQYDARRFVFPGDRLAVRMRSLEASLLMSTQHLNDDYRKLEHQYERLTA